MEFLGQCCIILIFNVLWSAFKVSPTKVYFLNFRAVDHQWDGDRFATAGAGVQIWNHNKFGSNLVIFSFSDKSFIFWSSRDNIPLIYRSVPEKTFEWGTDTVISVRFNPGEPNILATTASYV